MLQQLGAIVITLHFGVMDMPYANGGSTTGSVAERLEQNYGIMEYFAMVKAGDIAKELESDLTDFVDDSLSGRGIRAEPFGDSCSEIEKLFKRALTERFMDGSNFSGRPVPTMASLGGISQRFKNRRNKRGVRPSFVDTGAYRASFRAWVEL